MRDPATSLLFDPSTAMVVRTPPGVGYGYWVGGHKVSYDAEMDRFVLFYRERSPLERARGGRCAVAVSADGIEFETVWEATKDEFAANSIEVGHCVRFGGEWHLYVSYEYAPSATWRVDVLRAAEPDGFDVQGRRTVVNPHDFDLPWIKDPFVWLRSGDVHLYMNAPPRKTAQTDGAAVTAGPRDATVLAVSADGLYFPTIEYVFEAGGEDSWHGRRARINSIIPWEQGFVATWDGGRTSYDNYEEWAGLATSDDGKTFRRIDTAGPWVRSPYGCVRYVQALRAAGKVYLYFEFTREDGSHDLRVAVVDL